MASGDLSFSGNLGDRGQQPGTQSIAGPQANVESLNPEIQAVKWKDIGSCVLCERAIIRLSGLGIVHTVPTDCVKDASSDQQKQVFLETLEGLKGLRLGKVMQASEKANIEMKEDTNDVHILPYYFPYHGNLVWTVEEQKKRQENRDRLRVRHGFTEPEANLCLTCKEASITAKSINITVYGNPSISTSYAEGVSTIEIIF